MSLTLTVDDKAARRFTSPVFCKLRCAGWRSTDPVGTEYCFNLNGSGNTRQSGNLLNGAQAEPLDDKNCNSKCSHEEWNFGFY